MFHARMVGLRVKHALQIANDHITLPSLSRNFFKNLERRSRIMVKEIHRPGNTLQRKMERNLLRSEYGREWHFS